MTTLKEKSIREIIDVAEEIRDPLDGFLKRVAGNPGAPFETDVL